MNEQLKDDEIEIDLQEIFRALLHNLGSIIACTVAGILVAVGIAVFLITPQYTASTMIYILTKTTSLTSLADLQMGSQLTVDFQTLATSRPVIEAVIDELDLKMKYQELVDIITIENPPDTRILKMSVEHPNAKKAREIADTMAEMVSDRVAEVMTTDKPTTVEYAVVPEKPSSPNTGKFAAIGGLIGLFLSAGIIILRHIMDDTIKNSDDVRKYLQLNTLAMVPIEKDTKDTKRNVKDGKRTKKEINAQRDKSSRT